MSRTMHADLPVLPARSLFKASQQRDGAAQERQFFGLDGTEAPVAQRAAGQEHSHDLQANRYTGSNKWSTDQAVPTWLARSRAPPPAAGEAPMCLYNPATGSRRRGGCSCAS